MTPKKPKPQGKMIGGIWQPTKPELKGMTKLEKYQKACDIADQMKKKKDEYTKAREKYRRIAQQLSQMLAEQQKYLSND